MTITLSDSNEENEEENKAFTRKCETDSDISNEDPTDKDVTKTHKYLIAKWEESCLLMEQ
jgi:hypothetical protein